MSGQGRIGLKLSKSAFGVSVARDMMIVAARVLPAPDILYKDKQAVSATGASWNIMKKHFAVPGRLANWTFLTLGNARFPRPYLDEFRKGIKSTGLGEQAPMRPPGALKSGYHAALPGTEDGNDASIMVVFRTMMQQGVNFVLVILPTNSAVIYARVKYWADVKAGQYIIET